VPIAGSLPLVLLGTAMQLITTTSMGMLIATLSCSMPQFGLLLLMLPLPLQILSGSITQPVSLPTLVQRILCWAATATT
jgi:ABC-2 type transport system permease protein